MNKSIQNIETIQYVTKTVYDQYLKSGFNYATVISIVHMQTYVILGLEYSSIPICEVTSFIKCE